MSADDESLVLVFAKLCNSCRKARQWWPLESASLLDRLQTLRLAAREAKRFRGDSSRLAELIAAAGERAAYGGAELPGCVVGLGAMGRRLRAGLRRRRGLRRPVRGRLVAGRLAGGFAVWRPGWARLRTLPDRAGRLHMASGLREVRDRHCSLTQPSPDGRGLFAPFPVGRGGA